MNLPPPPNLRHHDPYFDYVESLLLFNNSLDDEIGHIWQTNGIITYDNNEVIVSSNNYIYKDIELGKDNEPFTIDFYVTRLSQTPSGYGSAVMQWGTTVEGVDGFSIEFSVGQMWGLFYRLAYSNLHWISHTGDDDYNRNHVAISYDGNNTVVYVNGKGKSVPNPNNLGTTRSLRIGLASGKWLYQSPIKIDNFRITKGIVRWDDDFIPPTIDEEYFP